MMFITHEQNYRTTIVNTMMHRKECSACIQIQIPQKGKKLDCWTYAGRVLLKTNAGMIEQIGKT